MSDPLPYRIAALVYLFNAQGDLLLLHRRRAPNKDLFSPIGGKLEQSHGESPFQCAIRETFEEVGITLAASELRVCGIISEKAFEGHGHWLMFCFEALTPQTFPARDIPEGRLEWVPPQQVPTLNIPDTDRHIIWPLMLDHSRMLCRHNADKKGSPANALASEPFYAHIDCSDPKKLAVHCEYPVAKHWVVPLP